jgi:hypothetical protein
MGERGRTHELGVALASAEQRLLESQRSPAFASGAPGVERFEVLGPPDPSSYLALMVGRGASLDVPAREPESDSGASEAGSDSSLLLRYRGREGSVLLDL